MVRRTKKIAPTALKAVRMAGYTAGRTVAQVQKDILQDGLKAARRISVQAAREFEHGFKKGLGKKR